MFTYDAYDAVTLKEAIRREGGIIEALDVGIMPENFSDPILKEALEELQRVYFKPGGFEEALTRVVKLLASSKGE